MPKSTLEKYLQKIYPLLKCGNIYDLKKIVEAGETSRGKVRDFAGLSTTMDKVSHPNYLSDDKKSLVVTAAEIEDDHGLPLESHALLEQFQHISKEFNLQRGNNRILKTSSPKYCRKVVKYVNERYNKHGIQKKSCARG